MEHLGGAESTNINLKESVSENEKAAISGPQNASSKEKGAQKIGGKL